VLSLPFDLKSSSLFKSSALMGMSWKDSSPFPHNYIVKRRVSWCELMPLGLFKSLLLSVYSRSWLLVGKSAEILSSPPCTACSGPSSPPLSCCDLQSPISLLYHLLVGQPIAHNRLLRTRSLSIASLPFFNCFGSLAPSQYED
jgi:hypothetical protein